LKKILEFYTNLSLFGFLAALKFRKNYQPLPALGIGASADREKRHKVRLKAIRDNIEGLCSILEIGCNVGFYTLALAQDGNFVTGIDSKAHVLFLTHIKDKLKISNIALSNMWLSPENVGLVPYHDVILCMSVAQHWCRAYGEVEAFDMLKALSGKCKTLFFDITECSNMSRKYNEKFKGILPDMGDDPEAWLRNWFISNTRCERVETIAYVRGRHLFKIEFKNGKDIRNKSGLKIVHSI